MNNTEKLFSLALETRLKAYAPYSGFKVGATILSTHQHFHAGCNVENISYPCGTCAEAGAIAAMITFGDKEIAEILIIADSSQLIAPCGACLQRIQEFSTTETLVHLANLQGIQKTYHINELLPFAFDEKELKK